MCFKCKGTGPFWIFFLYLTVWGCDQRIDFIEIFVFDNKVLHVTYFVFIHFLNNYAGVLSKKWLIDF